MRRSMSQGDMAKFLGVPASNVAAWEAMAHGTTRSRIAEIAARLGVSADYLMTGEPGPLPGEPIVFKEEAPARSGPEVAIRFTTAEAKAAECINHLVDYLNDVGADRDTLSWLLVELRKKFPLSSARVYGVSSSVGSKLRSSVDAAGDAVGRAEDRGRERSSPIDAPSGGKPRP